MFRHQPVASQTVYPYELFSAVKQHDCKAVERYISLGGDVNAQDDFGNTALMIAATRDKKLCSYIPTVLNDMEDIITALHRAGANVNLQNNRGRTALMHVGMDTGTSFLNGRNRDDHNNTGRERMIRHLFSLYGAQIDVSITDDDGKNALDYLLENARVNGYHPGITYLQNEMKQIQITIDQATPLLDPLVALVRNYSIDVKPIPSDAKISPMRIIRRSA